MRDAALVLGGAEGGAGVGNAVLGANLHVRHHLDALEPGGGDLLEVGVLLVEGSGWRRSAGGEIAAVTKCFGAISRGTAGRAARDFGRIVRIARAISRKGPILDPPSRHAPHE